MSFQSFLAKFIPSFRARNAILAELTGVQISTEEIIDGIRRIDHKLDNRYKSLLSRIDRLNKLLIDLDQKNEYLFFCLQHLEGEAELDTKKRVFLNMPKASGEVHDFQCAADYILRRVKAICDENGISFALCGGTLLGAVRHHGFIPWDDDVDIDILRDDFTLLKEHVNTDEELEIRRYYRYMEKGTKPGYLWKVKLKESDQFFIDVFPLDFIGIESGMEEVTWKDKEALCEEFCKELRVIFEKHDVFYEGNDRPEAIPEMDQEVSALEEKYLNHYTTRFLDGKQITHFTRGIGHSKWLRSLYRIQKYDKYLPFERNAVVFEGKEYDTFRNFDGLLRFQYGDYWSLPGALANHHSTEYQNYSAEDQILLKKNKNS